MTTTFATEGDSFSGRSESPMGAQDIAGKVDGDTLTWSADITTPVKLTLEFTAKVDGDKMTGACKMGAFGNAPLTGERA